MSSMYKLIKAHPFITFLSVLLVLLVFLYKPLIRKLLQPLPTSFLVQGDTTAFTFTSKEQIESQSQAGLFASSDTRVDIVLSCSKLEKVLSKMIAPCASGSVKLDHIKVEALRLGPDTQVDLLVADKDLFMTLTAKSKGNSLITLLFDAKSRMYGAKPSSNEGMAGEWIAGTDDASIQVTFLHPHFLSGDNQGGQRLSRGTAFAFQQDGRSGFLKDTGLLLVGEPGNISRKPLNNDLLQVYSVQEGEVRALSPVTAPDGSLDALHAEVKGISQDIQVNSPLTGIPDNQAFNDARRITGKHLTSRALLISLFTSVVAPLFLGLISTRYSHHLSSRKDRKKRR